MIVVGGLLGVLAAAVPAVWSARTSLSSLLASSAVRGGGGHGRLRRGMIVAQVALSLVLLSSGALVVRSFEHLLRADPGLQARGRVHDAHADAAGVLPQVTDVIAFQDRVHDALAAIPGVTGASATSARCRCTAAANEVVIGIPGAPGNTGNAERDAVLADGIAVRANYVEVMGMRLVAGRTFTESRHAGVPEAMIDSALRQAFLSRRQRRRREDPVRSNVPLTIVGVVDQARLYGVHADGRPQMFVRAEDIGQRPLFFVMRTTRDPHSLLPDVRAAVRRVDPRVAGRRCAVDG